MAKKKEVCYAIIDNTENQVLFVALTKKGLKEAIAEVAEYMGIPASQLFDNGDFSVDTIGLFK